jgi:hypothetical protein
MFIKVYNEEKEVLAVEAEEFDLLITTNDLIMVVVIMFIKFSFRVANAAPHEQLYLLFSLLLFC